jgi:general secretion pathway protein B
MSFILDALKKSESERKRADAPALYETQMAPVRPRVATWLIVLGALLLINIVVLSVVLLRGTRGAAPPVDANGAAAPAPAAVSPTPAPMASPPASPAPSAPAQMAGPPPAGGSAADPGAAGNATGAAAAPTDDDAPAVDPAHAAVANTADVPTYDQVASAPGANLPELKLDLHAYAANPADRFVFLSGVNLKEGQSSPGGIRVETITPDGAILSWRGTRFFLHSQ